MKKTFLFFLLLLPLIVSAQTEKAFPDLIPYPQYVVKDAGIYQAKSDVLTYYSDLKGQQARDFDAHLAASDWKLRAVNKKSKADIFFQIDTVDPQLVNEESYRIEINKRGIMVSASTDAGLFYAYQTLLQVAEQTSADVKSCNSLPFLKIFDTPRLGWRGWHMDVSRHFFDKAFLIRQLRNMARYKLNKFHWHLTDDPGWRIEIKRYPELTQKTAYRPQHLFTEWTAQGMKFCNAGDPQAYGGYYTQDDVREIVEFARKLHITVVPEIEMPGHSWEVLAAKPELGCTGKPYANGEMCIGNEETFVFLKNVLDEVLPLFPSAYIHIGGDEANRSHWEKCEKCQKRMQAENLKDVKELQSYLTRRIEKYLESKGRHLLGWDEIIEGGLSPNATVMSWRGEEGGIVSAQTGHDAVMTPWVCYLDNAQDDPRLEPRGVGGYVSLKKTYDYDPVPKVLNEKESKHILGIQGNVWAEHIPTPARAEYMIYPRIFAIAENGWTVPSQKSYTRFHHAAQRELDRLKTLGFRTFDLRYEHGDRKESLTPVRHKALGKKVTYNMPYSPKYVASGDVTLVDGKRGTFNYQEGFWQGFETHDFDVTIDLDEVTDIKKVSACFMQRNDQWIWMPREVVISISDDGQNFTEIHREGCDIDPENPAVLFQYFTWEGNKRARFVHYHAIANGRVGGWLFTDEVIVE